MSNLPRLKKSRSSAYRGTRPQAARIARKLLHWYDRVRRDLPWRRTSDPYAIWVSEVMLQQTQIATVIPFYRRFLRAFPTVAALDRAAVDEVLSLWSGLGYYRRAHNLKRAARQLMRAHAGQIPRDLRALSRLPGIGRYTAGALMSIAFGQPHVALDGNARRVLSRLFKLRSVKAIEHKARELLPRLRPGDFNQALMELGSTVCRAQRPNCTRCPVARCCGARQSGLPRLFAPLVTKPRAKRVEWPMALLQRNGKILLRRRPAAGLLGGLWELPGGERRKNESRSTTLRRHLDGIVIQLSSLDAVGTVRHTITDRRIRAPIYRGTIQGRVQLARANWRWVSFASLLKRCPVSSLTLKAVRLLEP